MLSSFSLQVINSSSSWCEKKPSTVKNADERDHPSTTCIWPGAAQVFFPVRTMAST